MIELGLICFYILAWILCLRIQTEQREIKSDEDLMLRFVLYEHRRSRKEQGRPYLY